MLYKSWLGLFVAVAGIGVRMGVVIFLSLFHFSLVAMVDFRMVGMELPSRPKAFVDRSVFTESISTRYFALSGEISD